MEFNRPSTGGRATIVNPQSDCDFFRLPRELRDIIYNYVFGDGLVQGRVHLKYAHIAAPQSALTRTCRRLHGEATAAHQDAYATFWKRNAFQFVHSFPYDHAVLTTKHIKHMTRVFQYKYFGDFFQTVELRLSPGKGDYDLVCEQETSEWVSAGSGTYQVRFKRRDCADWLWIRTTES
jgi:hypothetical protein